MRRWLLQVNSPEADNLIYSRHRPHRSRHISRSQELFWFWTVLITGLFGVPYIVDRTMVRTLTGTAKPEPKPQAAGAAQDGTPSTAGLRRRQMRHRGGGTGAPSPSEIV